ncbi:MAG: S-adenosylmethionine:tRNA ribosyltransferase-isomerase, partial [Gammaproteobacteria bacterium]
MYSLSDFDFDLPPERIAQVPLPDRSASRLLHLDGAQIADRQFADIVELLTPGDLLVMNDTRVLKARFFGVKETGGAVEVLVERVLDTRTVLAQVRASKSPKPGNRIRLADAFDVVTGERAGDRGSGDDDVEQHERLDRHGLVEQTSHDRRVGSSQAVAHDGHRREPARGCERMPAPARPPVRQQRAAHQQGGRG